MKPVIRCSELDRILACPGSRILAERVRPRVGLEGAEGHVLHWKAGSELVTRLGAQAPTGGMTPPSVAETITIRSNNQWVVDWFFNLVKFAVPDDWSLEIELPLEWEFDRWILSGHLDVAGTSADGRHSHDLDLKTGYRPVLPAKFNEQVNGYLVLRRLIDEIEHAKFTIGQPHNSEDDGYERISTVELEGKALEDLPGVLDRRVCLALDQANVLESGPDQCKWCPVGVACPAIQAEIEHMRIILTNELLARIKSEPDDALLGDIIIAARTIAQPIADAEVLLKERLGEVTEIEAGCGTRISQKLEGGKYKVLDPVRFLEELLDMVDVDRLAPALQYSRGRIEDAIAAQFDIPKSGSEDQTAEMVFDARLGPFVEQGKRSKLIFQ